MKSVLKAFIKKHMVDLIVIASLLLFSTAILLVVNLTKIDGTYVEVTKDGVVIASYPLSTDGEYTLNGGTNILTVKDGVAYMTYSSCPDHTCEHTGKVSHVGETIVCLPNKLTVTVIGEKSDDSVDFVS